MSSPPTPTAPQPPTGDARSRLLGLVAYAELSAGQHLAVDAALAPDLARRVGVLRAAGLRMDRHRILSGALADAGADPLEAMTPYGSVIDDFHARTVPRRWPEALVKAWVTDGLATDIRTAVADRLSDHQLGAVVETSGPTQLATDAPEWLAEVLRDDAAAGGRLALWARRLVGEVVTRAQQLAAADEALAALVTGAESRSGTGLAEVHTMIAGVLKRHDARMATAGLRP